MSKDAELLWDTVLVPYGLVTGILWGLNVSPRADLLQALGNPSPILLWGGNYSELLAIIKSINQVI